MSDDILNTSTGQSSDLAENAAQQNVNGFPQARVNDQSSDISWDDRKKEILAEAYRQTQSLISKSENRQTNNFQGMIDQFKRDYGVTLTPEQAQEMAQNQAAKSQQNAQVQAQAPAQTAPASDPSFQGFMYYHGMNPSSSLAPLYREMYELQNTLGVQLEKSDEEYQKFLHPEKKYSQAEFVEAWKQACLNKMMRVRSAQQAEENSGEQNTNLGQMPLVGSRGRKSKNYDPKRSAKSYFSQYVEEKKL
jgi:hypothetical protein